MNRFHVHISVEDLDQSIRFYSALFDQSPTRTEKDYAKWMLDDPAVNFAISNRGTSPGIRHLGIQTDEKEALQALRGHARSAEREVLDEPDAYCCYAQGDKHWLSDPQGVSWELFHTVGEISEYGTSRLQQEHTRCCAGGGQGGAR